MIEKIKKFDYKSNKNTILFICNVLLLLIVCIVHAASAGHYADFFPINGTYQNFNPVRRLLAGQIPYRDFQDYLGMGHLYTGAIATLLFGGNYQGSLQAFSLLTFTGLAIFSLMSIYAVTGKKETAVSLTNIFLILLLVQPLFFRNMITGTSEILEALLYALGTGNSARFVRGMILPLSCLLLFAGLKLVMPFLCSKVKSDKLLPYCIYGGIGVVAGFCFPWSNDYGISCWLCLTIMTFWLILSRERKLINAIKYTAVEVILSLISLVVSVEIFTLGHVRNWFSSTFGTGGYQAWYYNSEKSYYLYNVDFSFIMIIQLCLTVTYLVKMFIAKGTVESLRRYGILAYANMACFCAVNEYRLLSGGSSREVALAILFFTIIAELIHQLVNEKIEPKFERIILYVSIVSAVSWTVQTAKEEIVTKYFTDKDGVYIEQLGGNLTSLGNDLINANEFLNSADFFSTYASAQEVVEGKFQPSGTDYIIHILGDDQRAKYLEAFNTGTFAYAATIRETYTDWEFWAMRANWFFYRELYEKWHPVFANAYELYWERNSIPGANQIQDGINLQVIDIDESTKKIAVACTEPVNGFADVYIDYAVNKLDNRNAKLAFHTDLKVQNSGVFYSQENSSFESNYLRSSSAEYIPVRVVNGYGEVTLSTNPSKCTYLTLNQATCARILTASSDYQTIDYVDNSQGHSILRLLNTTQTLNDLYGIKGIEYNNSAYNVSEITNDDRFIYVSIDGTIELFHSNQIRLIR